jgi:uncharacterized phage protein gp47/JayE
LASNNLNVLAHVSAAVAHGLYGYLDWIARQAIVDTADDEYLERWASIWGVPRRAAASATGLVTLSGLLGASIFAGAQLSANGALYVLLEDVTFEGATAEARVEAVVPGAAGNFPAGALTLVTPAHGVHSSAAVSAAGLTGGTDIEPISSLRARLLDRIQRPPRAGAAHDYEAWAKEVPCVTRVWVASETPEPGYVTLYFVHDHDASFIPGAGEIAKVEDHIKAIKPLTAKLCVVAPVPVPLDFVIDAVPATASVREAVEAELRDLFLRDAAPGAPILISRINEAISIAHGELDHYLLAPTGNVYHQPHEIAVFGSITWA